MSGRVQIVIKGHLDPSWENWFRDITVGYDDDDNTMLTGTVPDQPALHGILDRIRDLNLRLISVTQFESEENYSKTKENKK